MIKFAWTGSPNSLLKPITLCFVVLWDGSQEYVALDAVHAVLGVCSSSWLEPEANLNLPRTDITGVSHYADCSTGSYQIITKFLPLTVFSLVLRTWNPWNEMGYQEQELDQCNRLPSLLMSRNGSTCKLSADLSRKRLKSLKEKSNGLPDKCLCFGSLKVTSGAIIRN